MKKVIFLLEYKCSPIWIYNCSGEIIKNGLTTNLENLIGNDVGLRIKNIQSKFDELFIDNETIFEYKGFPNKTARENFICEVNSIIALLKSYLNENFCFEMKTDLHTL